MNYLRILVPLQIYQYSLEISGKFQNYCLCKTDEFPRFHTFHKEDFDTYCGKSLSFTRNISGEPISRSSQNISSPSDISSSSNFCKTWCGSIAYVQQINFQDHIHKRDFDIYYPLTISDFPQMQAQNQYVCVGTQNISSLSDISSLCFFCKF